VKKVQVLIAFVFLSIVNVFSADPVSPEALPEAKALLQLLNDISGKYTLTGQHNYPNIRDKNTRFAKEYIGSTPAVFSIDLGHARAGDTDSYLARPEIVQECIRQHKLGSIITICWHAVPPTADEPVTFRPLPGADPIRLKSVQGQLLDDQFKDVLTPGTALHKQWMKQVDSIAVYLKKLQDAGVPVLWRPYHEMNGDWFWWGGRHGTYSTKALYIQIFERLVKYHKLRNLIWVWSVDRVHRPEMNYSHYFPGTQYLDVIGLDVYGSDFKKVYYDSLLALSAGKPLILAEVGNPPKREILDEQPKWALWVVWAGMVRNTLKKQWQEFVSDPKILFLEDDAYGLITEKYRKACGLPALRRIKPENPAQDFSGEWFLNEEKGDLGNGGVSNLPYKLNIYFNENGINIKKTIITEYADDRIVEESYILDGTMVTSTFWNSPRVTSASWSASGDTMIIKSKTTFSRDGQVTEAISNESWNLINGGQSIQIMQFSRSPWWGERRVIAVYEKN
jgi:mannan endo-1,4-beta-mannosidase